MYHKELYRCFLFREMSREKIDSILGLLKVRIKSYQKNEIVISEESEVREEDEPVQYVCIAAFGSVLVPGQVSGRTGNSRRGGQDPSVPENRIFSGQ